MTQRYLNCDERSNSYGARVSGQRSSTDVRQLTTGPQFALIEVRFKTSNIRGRGVQTPTQPEITTPRLGVCPLSRFWRPTASIPINMREHLYSHVLHIIVQTSSSLKVFACLCDLRRQCSQPLFSVSFKDITIPPLLWRNVGCELGIAGDASGSHAPRRLFELVEAELGPYRTDAVEDREGRTP